MQTSWKVFAAAAFLGLSASGCGSSGGDPVTANIAGDDAASQGDLAPAAPAAPPVVLMKTTQGDIRIELDPAHTPLTVHNFLYYVDRGAYDQTVFHDVEPGFMILGGGYDKDLKPKPADQCVRNEADLAGKNLRGTIAMGRPSDVIDGAAREFFINLADNANLDFVDRSPEQYGYCVFGKIVEGLEVAEKISKVRTDETEEFPHLPAEPVVVQSIRRVR